MISREMKTSLKNAINVWRMEYLISEGVDPMPKVSDFGGYLEVSLDPVISNEFTSTGEEE